MESKRLNEELEQYTNPEIQKSLDDLKWLIDPELFTSFEERVKKILNQNPWCENIVAWELWKTTIQAETLVSSYRREFRWILTNWANDTLDDVA